MLREIEVALLDEIPRIDDGRERRLHLAGDAAELVAEIAVRGFRTKGEARIALRRLDFLERVARYRLKMLPNDICAKCARTLPDDERGAYVDGRILCADCIRQNGHGKAAEA